MRILLTGGAGYIGSALSLDLLARGHEVTVFDRLVFGLPFESPQAGLVVLKGDVRDAGALRVVVRGQDAVVHLAFASNDPNYRLSPDVAHAINIAPIPLLLTQVINANVPRFVFLSSCSVYGSSRSSIVDERSDAAPLTDYARHKVECEALISRVAGGTPLCWTVLRPATVCGRSPRQRFDLLLNRMLAEAVCKGTIRVVAGETWRPVLPLGELVETISHILDSPAETVRAATYNVAFESRTIGQWAHLVQELAGGKIDAALPENKEVDARSYVVRSDRLLKETGYVPRHTVADSLARLITVLRSGEITDPLTDFRWFNLESQIRHDFGLSAKMCRVL